MTVVPNHRKDVDMYLLLILDLSGKALATLHVWISVEKLQLWGTSELTKERERGQRLQMYTEPKSLMFHSD